MARTQTRSKKPQARTTIAKAKFLASYATHGIVLHACIAAGIPRSLYYLWMEKDAAFSERCAAAEAEAIDLLEAEARRRAVEGWDEPVYQKGAQVGVIRKFSDALLALKLKAKKPEYRDKFDITANMTVSPSEASAILAEGRRRAAQAALEAPK